MKQQSMTDRIVKNINHALEVIPKALHLEGNKPARKRRPSVAKKAKRRVSTGLVKARRLAAKGKRKVAAATRSARTKVRAKRGSVRKASGRHTKRSAGVRAVARAA